MEDGVGESGHVMPKDEAMILTPARWVVACLLFATRLALRERRIVLSMNTRASKTVPIALLPKDMIFSENPKLQTRCYKDAITSPAKSKSTCRDRTSIERDLELGILPKHSETA